MKIQFKQQILAVVVTALGPLCWATDEPPKQVQPPAEQFSESDTKSQSISISVNSSSRSEDDGNDITTKVSGKIIMIGPDGEKKEYNLGDKLPEGVILHLQNELGHDVPTFVLKAMNPVDQTPRFMIGVICEPASDVVRNHLNLGNAGLVVTNVSEKLPAAEAGIQKGDILLSANDRELTSISDLVDAVTASQGQEMKFQTLKNGTASSVAVTPKKSTDEDAMKSISVFAAATEGQIDEAEISEILKKATAGAHAASQENKIIFRRFGPGLRLENSNVAKVQVQSLEGLQMAAKESKAQLETKHLKSELASLRKRMTTLESELKILIDSQSKN